MSRRAATVTQADVGKRRISPYRPPAYVSRETGAAELDISSDTWDAMVKSGVIPQPIRIGISGTTPRWRWEDVDAALSGRAPAVMVEPEPFFRRRDHGKAEERRRDPA